MRPRTFPTRPLPLRDPVPDLSSSTGMGSSIALYGIGNSRKLIAEALARTHP